jgi:hypothetical protein
MPWVSQSDAKTRANRHPAHARHPYVRQAVWGSGGTVDLCRGLADVAADIVLLGRLM